MTEYELSQQLPLQILFERSLMLYEVLTFLLFVGV